MSEKEYIEREAARDLMERALEDDWEIQYANDRLRDIPAADVVEVRHGMWVNNDDGYGCEDLWWCSACKEEFVLIEGTPHDNGYHYCPNCGAKMDGEVH